MSDLPFSESIPPQKLAIIISTYFDDNEIQDICFRLDVDYEELAGQTKSAKARNLVQHMKRRNRLDELMFKVRQLRPNIEINIGNVLNNALAPNDPQLVTVKKILTELRLLSERLYEWKELHNHLDELINIFSQFSAQVDRLAIAGEPVEDMYRLNDSWQPVHRRTNVLLLWSEQDVEHIGKPYILLADGSRKGEKWAVELAMQHDAISDLLANSPVFTKEQSASNGLSRFIKAFNEQPSPQTAVWQQWWRSLRESTQMFNNKLSNHMFLADKELRKTALDLHDFSKETLWG